MMRKYFFGVFLVLVLMIGFNLPGTDSKANQQTNDLSELSPRFISLYQQNSEAVVLSTGTDRTRQIGMDIMNQGGNAIDAALAVALARIVEDIGQIVSFAGIFMMVYYEASSGKTYSLNACFKTALEETDPLTIPTGGIPNPRGVLVPGFMAGVQAAHDRFGRLSRAQVFAPAIDLAENGFSLTGGKIHAFREHWWVLGILPETRKIFLKKDYGLFNGYEPGDTFCQPEVAETLRQVVSQGAAYMYTGAWGRKLIDVVRGLGGRLSNRDMETYEVVWAEPTKTTYNGYEVHALGYPSLGAMNVVMGINLMECAELPQLNHCSESAEALYRLMYCSRVGEFFYAPYAPEIVESYIPTGNFSYEFRADKTNAHLIWSKIESGEWTEIERDIARNGYSPAAHSEAIIVADRQGNVVSICHTINANNWGFSGIFIDGVSIPAAAYHQRERMHKAGPGEYVQDTTNPCLVLRNGKPAVASSCVGSDLHCNTVQNLYNMLTFDMSPEASRETPKFLTVNWGTLSQRVGQNVFDQSVLDAVEAMGLAIALVDEAICKFCWIGLRLTH
jgi:gamma-glutamyltranspeptidase/glutathione hydrolase